MQITITGHHLTLDDSLREYATQKIQTLKKYSANIIKARAVLGHNRGAYHTELILRADHHRFFGEESHPDARASLDGAVEKVERQLQRFKEKIQRKHKHELEPGRAPAEPIFDEEGEFEYESELEYEQLEAESEPPNE